MFYTALQMVLKGVYSIAEVVDDSNKRPRKTLFLNLYTLHKEFPYRDDCSRMGHSLTAVENLLKANGVRCFSSIDEVAKFLNFAEEGITT